ncbi:MAG TPA: aspartate/glutamate racemase family protein [Galbitalea sp.]|jgi:hypothetical protein
MPGSSPLIALISATPTAIGPAAASISDQIPDARVWNLLDDRLLSDANAAGLVTPQLAQRMNRLISHAILEGADAVLLTCSMYGPVAQAFTAEIPVLPPDDAGFSEVIALESSRVLIVASFEAALADTTSRFTNAAQLHNSEIEVTGTVAAGALEAAGDGDYDALLRAVVSACEPFRTEVDAVFLAQYSLAPVAADLSEAIKLPIFSGPASAAAYLSKRLDSAGSTS